MSRQDGNTIALARAEVFQGLQAHELEALAARGRLACYDAGQQLFALGKEAGSLLVIRAGVVALTLPVPIEGRLDEVTLEEKQTGAVIAWSALVPPYRFTLGARARTAVELDCFEREELQALFAAHPRLHLVVTCNLNRIIASRVTLLEALVARGVQRLATEMHA